MTVALLLHRADGTPPSTKFQRQAFGPHDPFAHEREVAWQGLEAPCAGRMRFSGERTVASYPHTETLVLISGALQLRVGDAAPCVLQPGEGVVIACGAEVQLKAEAAQLVFCAAAAQPRAASEGPGITALRAQANFAPSSPPPTAVLLGPVPACRSDNVFTDEPSDYRAGVWDSTPYHRIVRPHPVHEFMFLLAGGVRLAIPDGSFVSARAGDAVFVPQGTPVGWESHDTVAKIYVVQQVKA